MKILPGIEIMDLALYTGSTLIVSDIHIGYEEALNKKGILVPRIQFVEIVRRMEKIFLKLEEKPIDTIIVNGDLKHEFGTISQQEWRNTLKFIDLLLKHAKKVVLIKGNHDTILGPIARKREVEVKDFHVIDLNPKTGESNPYESNNELNSKKNQKNNARASDVRGGASPSLSVASRIGERIKKYVKNEASICKILVAHGDKLPQQEVLNGVDAIVIGHEHPAITLREGPRMETFKCFLKGKYEKKHLIVQPSFNSMIEGTNILRDSILSPYLKQNLDNFEVYAVEDKVYNFGKLKDLRN